MAPYIIRKQGSTKGEQLQILKESLMDQISKNILSQRDWNGLVTYGEIRTAK